MVYLPEEPSNKICWSWATGFWLGNGAICIGGPCPIHSWCKFIYPDWSGGPNQQSAVSYGVEHGSDVSIILEKTYKSMLTHTKLQSLSTLLRTCTGEWMKVLGKMWVTVQCEHNASVDLPLVVVAGDTPSLFGRNWPKHTQLNCKQVGTVMLCADAKQKLSQLLKDYHEIFLMNSEQSRYFKLSWPCRKMPSKSSINPVPCHLPWRKRLRKS